MTESVALFHLKPAAQDFAILSNEERICHIRSDRWIAYSRAQQALIRLDELMTWPRKQRMPNLLIIGPTNNGKSMIIEKFRKDRAVKAGEGTDHEFIPIVVVQVPCEPSVARFYAIVLSNLGAPVRPQARTVDLEQMTLKLLRTVKTKMLIIDELHNILAGGAHVRRAFLNLLRFLGNELKIPIVGVGTREAYLAIRTDDQLENRFEPFPLPAWEEGDELSALLASFAGALPLKRPSAITAPDTSKYILEKTGGTIGEMTKLLTAAAIEAINTGEECINQKTLKLATYQSPGERRRAFERC
jgi:hypothetical protein